MATIGQGIVGGFRGAVGPVVGYQWRGRWCMRSRPQTVRNPRTEAQQRHRMMFKAEVQLASRMNWLLRESFAGLSLDAGLTPCNYFIRENQHCFGWSRVPAEGREGEEAEGRLTVDWGSLVLSHGPVAPVAFGVPRVTEGTTLTIGFERNPLHVRADAFDKVYLFLYCPELEACWLASPVYRRAQEVGVVLPRRWAGKEVQLWGVVSDDKGRWSETIYIGYGPLEDSGEEEDSECMEGSEYSEGSECSEKQMVESYSSGCHTPPPSLRSGPPPLTLGEERR